MFTKADYENKHPGHLQHWVFCITTEVSSAEQKIHYTIPLKKLKQLHPLSHPACKRAEHAISSYSRGEEAATRLARLQKEPVGLKIQAEIMLSWNLKERWGIRPTWDQKGKMLLFSEQHSSFLFSTEQKQTSCLPVVTKFREAHLHSVWYLSRTDLKRKNWPLQLAQQVAALVLTQCQSACYRKFFDFCFHIPRCGSYTQNSSFYSWHQNGQLVSTISKHLQNTPNITQESCRKERDGSPQL